VSIARIELLAAVLAETIRSARLSPTVCTDYHRASLHDTLVFFIGFYCHM
jgi:hypothetical protein